MDYSLENTDSVLQGDLEILGRHINTDFNKYPSQHEIRTIISPILRKWISDNGMRYFHDKDKKLSTYIVINTSAFVEECKNNDKVDKWIMQLPFREFLIQMYFLDKKDFQRCNKGEIKCDFNSFRNQKIAYNNGNFITREECIRFVANKMGGIHTQEQAKPLKNKAQLEFVRMMVIAFSPKKRIIANLDGSSELQLETYKKQGYSLYPLLYLVVLDSAIRFYKGVSEYLANRSR